MNKAWVLITRLSAISAVAIGLVVPLVGPARADQRQQIIDTFAMEAKATDQAFQAFSADRGRFLFSSNPAAGKPDTPSCTTCHTTNPLHVGQTRAGKEIAPMALSKSPTRYGDIEKVEKWFRRNCNSVLGRECSAVEKGDYLTFMFAQ